MNFIESSPTKPRIEEDVDPKIHKLLDGAPSDNYNVRQMQLALELLVTEQPETPLGHDVLEKMMLNWAESKWSKAFSGIVHNENFETHPRFLGQISRITLEDIKHFVETGLMPNI